MLVYQNKLIRNIIEIMALGAILPCLSSVGNGAMWARFVDQTVDRSAACLRNDTVVQVALHQIALIGLNFCFLSHLGYISLTSPLVGGLCLMPIFWVLACWGLVAVQLAPRLRRDNPAVGSLDILSQVQRQSLVHIRLGLEVIVRLNAYMSIAAGALFALAGHLVFAGVFGGLLVAAQLRRTYRLSLRAALGSESLEFVTANIAAVLIGAWYHRLRAVFDVSLRLRDYYKLRIKTDPIVHKVANYTDLTSKQVDVLMNISDNGKNLVPTAAHIDWLAFELPDNNPEGVCLQDYMGLAKKVCTPDHLQALKSALANYDDHFKAFKGSGEEIPEYVLGKVRAWLTQVATGNPNYPDQTARAQRYILWVYKMLRKQDPQSQARTIVQLTGSIGPGIDVCHEHIIDIAEQVYLSFAPSGSNAPIQRIVSCLLQGLRRHVLHQFLADLKSRYPAWALNPQERHLVNQLISVLHQRGIHLGLPEERTANTDGYYSGSIIEALLWYETAYFRKFFLNRYNAAEILTTVKSTPWESKFKDAVNEWMYPSAGSMTDSVLRGEPSAYDTINLRDAYRYGLLVQMGVLAPTQIMITELQKN